MTTEQAKHLRWDVLAAADTVRLLLTVESEGSFQGDLSPQTAGRLGAALISMAREAGWGGPEDGETPS